MRHSLIAVIVSFACCGCLRKGIDVEVTIGFDECFTSSPVCSGELDAGQELSCVGPNGDVQPQCHPACLLGLERLESCPVEGQCFNVIAGQLLETPAICTRF